jgi:SPP1 family predicted phage head-tail adaptor
MLDNSELTSMRSAYLDLMPDTCDILTATKTTDGQGGFTTTWATSSANVRCRMDAYKPRESLSGGAVYPFNMFMLTLPYDTTITTNSRVTHGGKTYNVIGPDDDKSWKITTRVILEVVNA